jgi:phytoene dehydrogenase-like protein
VPTRKQFADRIERILSIHIPDLRRHILARRARSPADLEAMNVNLVGGDPYGGACSIDQFFLRRPFRHSRSGTFALRGLHHIGASTHPGPGPALGGGSGFLTAKALCA